MDYHKCALFKEPLVMPVRYSSSNFNLSGSLKVVPVEQICQLVSTSSRNGMLELALEGFSAYIWFDNGLVVAAEYAGLLDQDAFNHFCTAKEGLFEFFPDEKPRQKRISMTVQAMLMEAFRFNDERPVEPAETIPRDFKGIKVINNILYVNKNLNNPLEMEFDIGCNKLLSTGARIIVIDLTHVDIIVSQYMGAIARTAAAAKQQSKRLIIRACPPVAQLLYHMQFDRLVEIETKIETSTIPWET